MSAMDRGFGAGGVLYLDCYSGLSGDMIVSSLLDLGVPLEVVEDAVAALPIDGWSIRREHEMRGSIRVTRFHVDVREGHQPHRHFSDIRDMIEASPLSREIKTRAVGMFEMVAEAEARVHGTTVEDVHFHEVGAVDSIVDIVGAAAAFDHIGARVVCRRVPVGTGFVRTMHGQLPLPAPATLLILRGVPIEGTSVEAELTTPTGAAIVKATASSFGPMPRMVPTRIGFGAGARDNGERSGILRSVLGRDAEEEGGEECFVVETNIDDVTGEVAGAAASSLLESGALDVWITPIQMKKGRPAIELSVLCRRNDLERLCARVMRETPTIGLRYRAVGRVEMIRSTDTVETEWGEVRVKIARGPEGSANASAEYEDCRRIANERGVPLKRVMAVATGMAQRLLDKG